MLGHLRRNYREEFRGRYGFLNKSEHVNLIESMGCTHGRPRPALCLTFPDYRRTRPSTYSTPCTVANILRSHAPHGTEERYFLPGGGAEGRNRICLSCGCSGCWNEATKGIRTGEEQKWYRMVKSRRVQTMTFVRRE